MISNFDVTMGSFDGAETCELLFLKNQERDMQDIYQQQLKNHYRSEQNDRRLLDTTMVLKNGIHKSYMKPNNIPLYVHKEK